MLVPALAAVSCSSRPRLPPARNSSKNGVWIGERYVSTTTPQATLDDLATRLVGTERVVYWFVNVGHVDATGRLTAAPAYAADFLAGIANWEGRTGNNVKLLAWVNGLTNGSVPVDLTQTATRAALVAECEKLVSLATAGSYVAGTSRPFDGIQLDLEPLVDASPQSGLVSLLDELRTGLAAVGRADAPTSLAVPPSRAPDFYYALAPHLDVFAVMTYDSGLTSAASYEQWIGRRAIDVASAIQGEPWSDSAHPPPTNSVEVLIGFAAYGQKAYHDPSVENVQTGAQGLAAALQDASDPALARIVGAAVYLHSDGTGSDGFASWTTDWLWFQQDWVGT